MSWRLVLRVVALTAGLTGLTIAAGVALRFGFDPLLVPVAIGTTVTVCVLAGQALDLPVHPWERPGRTTSRATQDRRLRHLAWSMHGLREGRSWDRIRDDLVDLIDHRLRQHHGVDRATHPEEARTVLHPQLQQLLDHPDQSPRSPAALSTIITRIEEL